MSRARAVAATRSNIVASRRKLAQVTRGAALLRARRELLARELLARARPALEALQHVEDEARSAYEGLLEALACSGRDGLRVLGWPARDLRVDVALRDVGGIHGIELASRPALVRSVEARGIAGGPGDAAAVATGERFERLLERLLEVAPEDLLLRRLGEALRQVSRLVNTLEQRVAPELAAELAAMTRTLDEREREEHLRRKRTAGHTVGRRASNTA